VVVASSAVTIAPVSRIAARIASSSSGAIVDMFSTRTETPIAAASSDASSARETIVPVATTVTSAPSRSRVAAPKVNGRSPVTAGTLNRPTRRKTGVAAAAAQRTADRVSAGSAGTTMPSPAIARSQERSSIE
jgi:hypothetical protein